MKKSRKVTFKLKNGLVKDLEEFSLKEKKTKTQILIEAIKMYKKSIKS